MSDALPLPPRPNLEQYRTLAKELVRAHESDEVRAWARRWLASLAKALNMEGAPEIAPLVSGSIDWLEREWRKSNGSSLSDAQFLIARAHGFESWPKFAEHLKSLRSDEGSPFERAADAIAGGDIETLRSLLRKRPSLVHERSARDHHSTLLHYTAANGIEDFRQRTPPNIVSIAQLLLDAGADVNAESDAYAGRSTALGLAATSVHPENAGVQAELLSLLLDRGATLNGPDGRVNACLANGRAAAAEFLAARGAEVDLEGAAGLGRLDLVRSLIAEAPHQQRIDGFGWACQFGRAEVAAFLLDHGVSVVEPLRYHRQTGLHFAAYEGHAETVKVLLERGAAVDAREDQFGGTPLDWALYGWGHIEPKVVPQRQHAETVAQLVGAGARLNPDWYAALDGLLEKARADPRMRAALEGRVNGS
jgi:ankyrin repeat protein